MTYFYVMATLIGIGGASSVWLFRKGGPYSPVEKTPEPTEPLPEPGKQPVVPITPPETKPAYDFSTPRAAYHSTRVLCDELGLTFKQKEILCACVFQESEFLTHPNPNQNKDAKTGQVWSTDFGIVQVNDWWHIGKGKSFPSVDYVLANPEKCIRWMIGIYKSTGALQPWSSYVSGAYRKHLSPSSRMRKLGQ